MKSFELSFPGLHLTECGGEPGGRVREGDSFCFDGGELIQAGGECAVVIVNQVSGVVRWWGGAK